MSETSTASGNPTPQATAFTPIMLDPFEHRAAIDAALKFAERSGLVGRQGPISVLRAGVRPRSWSLAADQTPFKSQSDRGTCWAFAGASALEAASAPEDIVTSPPNVPVARAQNKIASLTSRVRSMS